MTSSHKLSGDKQDAAASVNPETRRGDWSSRILSGSDVGLPNSDGWMTTAYLSYRRKLDEPDYPCFFGQAAERKDEVFYAFSDWPTTGLSETMHSFVKLLETGYPRHSLALFMKPDAGMKRHDQFIERFWAILQQLHDDDTGLNPGEPDELLWEFSFASQKMFVVGTSPTYERRRSRMLGSGMVLLFQPRQLFIDELTGKPISADIRRRIHSRMLAYDEMPVHPDIGFYGDESNREWKQYCLPDDNTPSSGACPFRAKKLT